MVIIIRRSGQYSNRLIQNLRIRLFCRKHNIRCWNLDMEDMEKYYDIPQTPKILLFLGKLTRLSLDKFCSLGIDLVFHANYPYRKAYLQKVKKTGIHLVDDWGLYDLEEENSQLEETRRNFQLKKEYYENNEMYKNMLKWKDENYTIVGVHIRRGDYREWRDGIYYYSDEVYDKYISQMRELLKGKKVKFLICTNEKCEISSEDIVFSHEPWYIDHLLLGMCDYTMGHSGAGAVISPKIRLWNSHRVISR